MPFTYSFYTTQFTTIQEVIAHMQQLNQSLQHSNLHNLRVFNTTYLLITQAVYTKFGQQYFDDDKRMAQFDILFAQYYFDALYNFANNQPCAPAWQLLFTQCQKNKLMQWQYLALGVNAHVNNDLPLTLHDFQPEHTYLHDFQKINQLIYQCIPEVVHSFQEQNYIIN